MNPEIKKQIIQFLKTAQIRRAEFKESMSDEEKKDNAIDFQSKIINILDYVYTNQPVKSSDLAKHYPRPELSETEEQYFKRIQKDKTTPPELMAFLSYCFQMNNKFSGAISLIISRVKHTRPNEFGQNTKARLSGKFTSNYSDPITFNVDGSIQIGNSIKISKGGSAKISNCIFRGPKGTLVVEHLDYSGAKFEGGVIVLKNAEKRVYLDWTSDCLNICRAIIDNLN